MLPQKVANTVMGTVVQNKHYEKIKIRKEIR